MKAKVDDYFNNGIIEMARIGENIVQRSVLSEKDRKKLIEQMVAEEPRIKSEINDLIKSISEKVLKCDPLQLLNFSQMMFQSSILGTTSEFQLMGLDSMAVARATEYIQCIYIANEKHQPEALDDPSELFFQISREINWLFQLVVQYYFTIGEKYKKSHSVDDELLSEMMEAQMAFSVRGQRYQVFEHDYYRGLLEPHNEIFERLFNISAAEIIDGIDKLQYALSQGRMDPMNDLIDMFEELGNADKDDAFRIIESQKEKGQELISQSFGFDLNDVCKVTGWNKGFVEALSFGLGDCPDFFSNEEYSGWPVVDLPVQKRPFIKINENYYCFDYYSFSDNFYRAIQKAVSRLDGGYNWSAVQQQASESMTAEIFKSLLHGCAVYQNNYYPKNNSLKQMCENDLIVQYYDVIIIVEIKAGSFVFTAPLLDFDQHIKSYKSLIKNPEIQCHRTYDYLASNPIAILYNKDKSEKTSIDMSKIEDVYMMSVTVDNINSFAARAEKLSFINSKCSAISVAIDDLMIYQDYFESPLVFLHYLKNRREATTIKHLVPTDELDHLGMYIHHNCYSMFFENNKTNRLNPVGYREDLDTYYNQKYLKQLKPTKPVQNIPVLFKKMISYLDKTDLTNRIRVSNYLLDFSTEAKNDFSNQVEGVFKHQKETKRATSVCAAGNGKNSLRYSCFVSEPGVKMISESEQQDYVWSNMLWNDEENRVQVDLNLDADMDVVSVNATFYSRSDIPADRREALFTQGKQRAQDRLNRYIAEHGHKIGRNELCPCGSGKKYKKCCGYYN